MSKHTPGPWREGRIGSHCILQGSDGTYIGKVDEFKAYDVDHLLECVNNCEGINPEAVGELLEVAKKALFLLKKRQPGGLALDITIKKLAAAIAKAEER